MDTRALQQGPTAVTITIKGKPLPHGMSACTASARATDFRHEAPPVDLSPAGLHSAIISMRQT